VGDKGKGTGKALKKAPKADKAGKRGLAPHEQRKQTDVAPAAKKPGKEHLDRGHGRSGV